MLACFMAGTEHGDEPIIDLEMLQFEGAVEGKQQTKKPMLRCHMHALQACMVMCM